mgnify:CR=1 FL=1
MKKAIVISLVLALSFGLVVTAVATTISTGLTKGQGGGSAPYIKAKWEMYGPCFDGSSWNGCSGAGGQGLDASGDPGAQFAPPQEWGKNLNYTVCAIATDPNGADDIDGVYADIYYPSNRPMHVSMDPDEIDNPSGGCGAFIEENTLIKLSKDEGYELICNQIRNNNYDLPVKNPDYPTLSDLYEDICGPEGELQKEEAFVYCDDKTLTWEDPAGFYKVEVFAQDNAGNSSEKLENHFEYLAFTGYEVDFSSVDYGEVLLDVHKKVSGDRNFDTADKPTVRNIGNTRLNMKVAQDDMNLGQSSGEWNVRYDARVGNLTSDWAYYYPFGYVGDTPSSDDYTELNEILDLSETEEMDFSIEVFKWPDEDNFAGELWLDAEYAEFDESLCD